MFDLFSYHILKCFVYVTANLEKGEETSFLRYFDSYLCLPPLYCFCLSHVIFICSAIMFLHFENAPALISWGDMYPNCTRRNLCSRILQLSSLSQLACFDSKKLLQQVIFLFHSGCSLHVFNFTNCEFHLTAVQRYQIGTIAGQISKNGTTAATMSLNSVATSPVNVVLVSLIPKHGCSCHTLL